MEQEATPRKELDLTIPYVSANEDQRGKTVVDPDTDRWIRDHLASPTGSAPRPAEPSDIWPTDEEKAVGQAGLPEARAAIRQAYEKRGGPPPSP